MKSKFREYVRQYLYAGLICLLLSVGVFMLPMFDTNGKLGFQFPETPLGWTAYSIIRGLIGIVTFLIFVSFDEQGKLNVQDDPRYKDAYNKMYSVRNKEYIPISPFKYKIHTRGIKAITMSCSTIITAFVVIDCVLKYNYNILAAYGLGLLISLITGAMQMVKAERYWTEEFPLYVEYYIEELKKENKLINRKGDNTDDNNKQQGITQSGRTSTEE